MITLVYSLIILCIVILIIWDMWGEKNWSKQVLATLVLIPLILRLLSIK